MSYYATSAERTELIAGLHALAEYLEDNTQIPVPRRTEIMVFPEDGTDRAKRDEIDCIAALLGTVAQEGAAGHYRTSLAFGPVGYRAVAIPVNPAEA